MSIGIGSGEYSNVYIYVGDAVRWDSIPDEISALGTTIKTVSSSIHSPSSFASLVTGRDVPNHGVYEFEDALHGDVTTLFDIDGYSSTFINSIQGNPSASDPLYGVLRQPQCEQQNPIEDVETPFIIMERGPGGHAPYASIEGSADEYFRNVSCNPVSEIRRDYEEGVSLDARKFVDRMEELKKHDLLDDTLVIYTSDHGEMLGELGMLGHNVPMHPSVVSVPTVFITDEGDESHLTDGVFRHTDLLPTVFDALGIPVPDSRSIDGVSILSNELRKKGYSYFMNQYGSGVFQGELGYKGVWDRNGGHVFSTTARSRRLLTLFGMAFGSCKRKFIIQHIQRALRGVSYSNTTYGNPTFSKERAQSMLDDLTKSGSNENKLDEETIEQLEDLGYME